MSFQPFKTVKERANEPSTWAGLGTSILGLSMGHEYIDQMPPEFWEALLVVLLGIVGVLKREKGN